MEVSGQPNALATYPRGKLHWYCVNRRLGKRRRQFGRFGGASEILLESKYLSDVGKKIVLRSRVMLTKLRSKVNPE